MDEVAKKKSKKEKDKDSKLEKALKVSSRDMCVPLHETSRIPPPFTVVNSTASPRGLFPPRTGPGGRWRTLQVECPTRTSGWKRHSLPVS